MMVETWDRHTVDLMMLQTIFTAVEAETHTHTHTQTIQLNRDHVTECRPHLSSSTKKNIIVISPIIIFFEKENTLKYNKACNPRHPMYVCMYVYMVLNTSQGGQVKVKNIKKKKKSINTRGTELKERRLGIYSVSKYITVISFGFVFRSWQHK